MVIRLSGSIVALVNLRKTIGYRHEMGKHWKFMGGQFQACFGTKTCSGHIRPNYLFTGNSTGVKSLTTSLKKTVH